MMTSSMSQPAIGPITPWAIVAIWKGTATPEGIWPVLQEVFVEIGEAGHRVEVRHEQAADDRPPQDEAVAADA